MTLLSRVLAGRLQVDRIRALGGLADKKAPELFFESRVFRFKVQDPFLGGFLEMRFLMCRL